MEMRLALEYRIDVRFQAYICSSVNRKMTLKQRETGSPFQVRPIRIKPAARSRATAATSALAGAAFFSTTLYAENLIQDA
jgi:hypothetical protein